jgi:hypothetical protein
VARARASAGACVCDDTPAQSKPAPDPARVKAAAAALEKAFRGTAKEEKLKAIQESSDVVDAEVVKLIARGLDDKELDVVKSSIVALRWMDHPDALKELHALAESAARAAQGTRSSTWSSSRRSDSTRAQTSIAILTDDIWSVPEHGVIQARILGLGRIRTNDAVEALMRLMKAAGPQRIQNAMSDFRLALVQLTGVDKGVSQQLWSEMVDREPRAPEDRGDRAEMPRELAMRWDVYWGQRERTNACAGAPTAARAIPRSRSARIRPAGSSSRPPAERASASSAERAPACAARPTFPRIHAHTGAVRASSWCGRARRRAAHPAGLRALPEELAAIEGATRAAVGLAGAARRARGTSARRRRRQPIAGRPYGEAQAARFARELARAAGVHRVGAARAASTTPRTRAASTSADRRSPSWVAAVDQPWPGRRDDGAHRARRPLPLRVPAR